MENFKSSVVLLLFYSICANAQHQTEVSKFGISFSGFVKTDVFYDTRQTSSIREGHFLLFPENVSYDANNEDINAKPSFNILSIQSRLKGAISGPSAFGAKTSGVLEADFFGNSGSGLEDVNGFRLRHAFVKLNWKNTELLAGQYWHPLFIAEAFPGVISFNTGTPFQPFSRNPQIRVTQKIGVLSLIGCVFSQRDFQSFGPSVVDSKSTSSSMFMRNSGIPNVNFQLQFKPDSTEHIFGIGVDYKTVLPEMSTVSNTKYTKYKSNNTLGSISAIGYAKFNFKPITFTLEGVYAQNASDIVMIGGYAVKEVTDTMGRKEFKNINTGSVWTDIQTNGKVFQIGLFAGYTKNMGSTDSIKTTIFYSRGSNIDNIYRIAPRVVFISGKLNIAVEIEHTVANYGIVNGNKKGGVTNAKAIANTRGLLSFIYKF